MPHEVDVTIKALDSLLFRRRENLNVLVLLNGGGAEALRSAVQNVSQVQVFESRENLGVAGGRAFLAAQDVAKKADIIALLDNDLLLTLDYLEPLCELLMQDHSIGVLGASVLNYQYVVCRFDAAERLEKGPLGQSLPRISNDDLRGYVEQHHTEEVFFHLGVDPDWMRAYFPKLSFEEEYARRCGGNPGQDVMLSRNTVVHDKFVKGGPEKIDVSNIAGCTQVFRRDLYDEVGGIRAEYSPYGYEDADFCIRSLLAGYKNFTLTNVFSLHGTDDRHQQRKTLSGLWPAKRNTARSYAFLVKHHCPKSRKPFLVKNFFMRAGIDVAAILWRLYHQTAGLIIRFAATVVGVIQAQITLVFDRSPATKDDKAFSRQDSGFGEE